VSKLFAKIVSTVLNPLVILAVLPYILVFKATEDFSKAYFWTIFSLIFILIFSVFVLIGIEEKFFSDLDVSKRKQRPLLYTFAIALSAIYVSFLYFLKAPEVLFIALFGLIFGLVAMEFINRITKASIHVATISAFATALTVGFGFFYILSFIFVPLFAWARIKTHNHTKRQTLIGGVMGVLITLTVYVIFKYII
jgi:membrane-associated phospholipid phosphatase